MCALASQDTNNILITVTIDKAVLAQLGFYSAAHFYIYVHTTANLQPFEIKTNTNMISIDQFISDSARTTQGKKF